MTQLTDAQLSAWSELAEGATAGPWHFVHCDDDMCMNALYVGTHPEDCEPDGPPSERIICGTLVQVPATIGHESGKWWEDAAFIAASRTALPLLVAEVRRLRAAIEKHRASHDFKGRSSMSIAANNALWSAIEGGSDECRAT